MLVEVPNHGSGKTLSCDDFPPDAKRLDEINSCGASELRWQQLKGLGTRLSVSRQKNISMQLLVDSKTATTFPKLGCGQKISVFLLQFCLAFVATVLALICCREVCR